MKLRLTDITIKQGRRAVDESKVRELAQIFIAEVY